jgi:hypothetical protein
VKPSRFKDSTSKEVMVEYGLQPVLCSGTMANSVLKADTQDFVSAKAQGIGRVLLEQKETRDQGLLGADPKIKRYECSLFMSCTEVDRRWQEQAELR